MILTVTMNPCIDRLVYSDELAYGGTNRITELHKNAAGKGINAARILKALAREPFCTGINYYDNGHLLTNALDEELIPWDFAMSNGTLRTNIKLLDKSASITELNERGCKVADSVIADARTKILKYARSSEIVMLCGSIPDGVPKGFYFNIISELNNMGIKCVLDTSGEPLIEGIKASPSLIKPNIDEFEQLCGTRFNDINDVAEHGRIIAEKFGIDIVLVSMGKDGAVAANREKAFYSPAPNVNVISTTGAGDAMLAASTAAYVRDYPTDVILKLGMSASLASVTAASGSNVEYNDIKKFSDLIEVKEIRSNNYD